MLNAISRTSIWVGKNKLNPRAKLRLFCLPYAGGWLQNHRPWIDFLSSNIDFCLIELPGREPRLNETPITNFSILVDEIATNIQHYLDLSFTFFGHSIATILNNFLGKKAETYASLKFKIAVRNSHT
jgi:medium-chain acyl-[acyl-carrier-protein] hydrolase